MASVTAGQFSCDACGKTYRWKPELAGRNGKCKCGAVIVCPKEESGKEDDGLFELAPDVQEKKPVRWSAAPAPPVGSARTLAYQSKQQHAEDSNQVMNLWAPLFLIVGAIVGQVIAALIRTRGNPASLNAGMTAAAIDMLFGTAFMMVGMWFAAKSRQIQLGPFGTSLLKLAAISVAPSAAIELLAIPLRIIPLFGWLFAWIVGFMFYFALIGAFFELDQDDTWYCVKIIFFVKVVTALSIIWGVAAVLHSAR